MPKKKGPRQAINLECSECRGAQFQRTPGVSRYRTTKNKKNTTIKLDLAKYCRYCNKHTLHKEIK